MKLRRGIVLRVANVVLVAALLGVSAFRATNQIIIQPEAETPVETAQPETDAPVETSPPQETELPVETAPPRAESDDDTMPPSYMIYYGALNEALIEQAKQYDIVIIHPKDGNIMREQIEKIQSAGTLVLGYLSVGEDLRTKDMTPEQMLDDRRFVGDGSGPQVDPREPGNTSLAMNGYFGKTSSEGTGYASYYLDDNDHDGKPDFNPYFGCAYTNIGDPNWFAVLRDMTLDGEDGVAGIREILTEDYGRGLGCDGLFLDTIDTCAPNSFTDDSYPGRTRFEWTAPGVSRFLSQFKSEYPDKYVLQNRGLFFYNYWLPHFDYSPRQYVDFLMLESYMLDSNTSTLYTDDYFLDNKNAYAPKLSAEAGRPDGFQILSLGYAEGPAEYQLKATLTGKSDVGLDILLKDMEEAQDVAGFSHYITDASLTLTNDFVLEHRQKEDSTPPAWSSVHNPDWHSEPVPRVGVGEVMSIKNGVTVQWDVAIDPSGVRYTLYYQTEPFDFEADPDLEKAEKLVLSPSVGYGYGYNADQSTWPYGQSVRDLEPGETYYFVIRASDYSSAMNEEKNTVVLTGVPK